MSRTYSLVIICDKKYFAEDIARIASVSGDPNGYYDEFSFYQDNTLDQFKKFLSEEFRRGDFDIEDVEPENIVKASFKLNGVDFTVSIPLELQSLSVDTGGDYLISRISLDIRRAGAYFDVEHNVKMLMIILSKLRVSLGFFAVDWSLIPQYNNYYENGIFKYSFLDIIETHPVVIIDRALLEELSGKLRGGYWTHKKIIEVYNQLLLIEAN